MTLFDLAPLPRHRYTDPDTSKAAAASVTPGETERYILAIFAGGGKFTDEELCAALEDRYGPTVRTARSRLTKAGLLRDSGDRRLSARGRSMIVWEKA